MTATQITNAKQIPATDELDAARATMATVKPGQPLTADQAAAQALLSQCGPDCKCGDCPSVPFAITLPADDPTPYATIGYVARTADPESKSKWVAMFPDHDDIMHDPQPVKQWGSAVDSFEQAEAQVRTNFTVWRRRHPQVEVFRGLTEALRKR